jgi:hypothetical protein
LFLLAITGAIISGCPASNDPDKLAARFVDAYYIEYDFDRALTMAEGGARARLLDEKSLADVARQKVELAQSKTHVYYGTPERHAVGDTMVHYTFDLQIRQGPSNIERKAVIMVAKRENGWRVIGFRETTGEDGALRVRSSTKALTTQSSSRGAP